MGSSSFTADHESLLWKIGSVNFPKRVEKFHYWPWSYAANLFGLVAIFAGAAGIISYYRRSYSTVFVFMSLSLLSVFFAFYLIGYYSILVNYYNTKNWHLEENRSETMTTSWFMILANLGLSCLLALTGITGFILGFLGVRGCQPKGLHLEDRYVPYAERPGFKGEPFLFIKLLICYFLIIFTIFKRSSDFYKLH